MKRYSLIVLILIDIVFFNSCNKENPDNQLTENDSIPLKYIDLFPDTNWIDLDNDNDKDIVLIDTSVLWFVGEPENIYISVQTANSLNPNVFISFGRKVQMGQVFLLDKDSIINGSLTWTNHYISYGSTHYWPNAHITNYIGIKKVENNDTIYGWIYKSNKGFLEYAIDTVPSDYGIIYAGHLYK